MIDAGKEKEKIIKEGIMQIWSGNVEIQGYNVKVKTSVKYEKNSGSYDHFKYVDDEGASHVKDITDWEIATVHSAVIYSKFPGGRKRTTNELKSTAAHEFGHLLGVGDAYDIDNDSPETDIMRWYNKRDVEMSNYDVLMLLKAAAYSEYQTWDKIQKSDVNKSAKKK